MKKVIFILFSMIFLSCSQNKVSIKGDLYFKLIEFISNKGMSLQQTKQLEILLDSIENDEKTNKKDKELINYFKKLKRNNMIGYPNVKIKTKNNEIKQVFLSKEEFEKLKIYTLSNLSRTRKKVILEIEIKEIDSAIYFSDNITAIKVVDGQTPWSK